MAVKDNSASLLVYSDTQLAAAVTEVLGIQPTSIHEKGDRIAPGGAGGAARHGSTRYREAVWCYTVHVTEARWDDDPSGSLSIRRLLDVIGDKGAELERLRAHYETHISWSGSTDSSQGGFVIEPETLHVLATLGCRLFGDVHLTAAASGSREAVPEAVGTDEAGSGAVGPGAGASAPHPGAAG